jgi:hypothetical protein
MGPLPSSAPRAIPNVSKALEIKPRGALGHAYEELTRAALGLMVVLQHGGPPNGELMNDF